MSEQNLERIRANLEKPLSAILDKNRQKSIEGRRESRERTTEQLEQEGFTERISEVQCGGSRSCGGRPWPRRENRRYSRRRPRRDWRSGWKRPWTSSAKSRQGRWSRRVR